MTGEPEDRLTSRNDEGLELEADKSTELRTSQPLIELDPRGRIRGVRFNNRSAGPVRTLSLQGGPMTAAEVAEFEALPYAREAVAVRRWDDQAKDPAATPPGSRTSRRYFRPLSGCERDRDSALTAVELCTLNATAPPR